MKRWKYKYEEYAELAIEKAKSEGKELHARNLKGRKGEQEDIEFRLFNDGFGAERFVASLLAFTSFGSYNSGYAVRFVALARPNLATPKTSFNRICYPQTLYEIRFWLY